MKSLTFKQFLTLNLTIFTIAVQSFGQNGIGIGTDVVHQSAVLEVSAPDRNQGMLIPRLSQSEINGISQPADGLVVFNTDAQTYYGFMNESWSSIGTPKGTIVMWSGKNIPAGWALCDGLWYNPQNSSDYGDSKTANRTTNTPDLRGRFIAGYDPEHTTPNNEYDNPGSLSEGGETIGDQYGSAEVILSNNQMPLHTHSISTNGSHSHNLTITAGGAHQHQLRGSSVKQLTGKGTKPDGVAGPGVSFTSGVDVTGTATNSWNGKDYTTHVLDDEIYSNGSHSHSGSVNANGGHTHSIGSSGGNTAHENRPPYYVLAFIMKL